MKNLCIFILVSLLFLPNASFPQNAKQVINKYFSLVSKNGKRKDWQEIKTIHIESKGYFIKDFEMDRPIYQKGRYLKSMEEQTVVKGLTTSKFYKIWPYFERWETYWGDTLYATFHVNREGTIYERVNGVRRELGNSLNFEFYSVKLINDLKKGKLKKSAEKVTKDGKDYIKVDISMTKGIYSYYFDFKNNLLEYITHNGIWTRLEEYKEIEGFLIPMHTSISANGPKYYDNRRYIVDINPPIDSLGFSF